MKPRSTLIVISLFLSAFLVAVITFTKWDEWFGSGAVSDTIKGHPDMVATTVEQISYTADGAKQYQLFAASMQQFISSNRSLMDQPSILFFDGVQPSWNTQSRQALSDNEGEKLHLTGDVTIEQRGVNESEAARLETQTLILYPKASYATTDDKVVIRKTGIYIEATGLDADLNENRITLREDVTSVYEPNKL